MSKYRGPLLIFLMFAAAASIAGFSVWFNQKQSYRVIQALSPRVTQLIAYSPQAEIAQLVPLQNSAAGDAAANDGAKKDASQDASNPADSVTIAGHAYKMQSRKNALGIDHFADVRHWLLHNDNYDWNSPPENNAAGWEYVLILSDGSDQARLAFDLHRQCLMLLPDGVPLSVAPMHEGLQAFFESQFSQPENPAVPAN
jgi:hypothetical protein